MGIYNWLESNIYFSQNITFNWFFDHPEEYLVV